MLKVLVDTLSVSACLAAFISNIFDNALTIVPKRAVLVEFDGRIGMGQAHGLARGK
jgi:hypothetical protein